MTTIIMLWCIAAGIFTGAVIHKVNTKGYTVKEAIKATFTGKEKL